jgi:hypothetical protein
MEKAEQETTMTYDLEAKTVDVFSAIRRDQSRLQRAGIKPTYGTAARGFGYRVPLSRFKWRVIGTNPKPRGFALKKLRSTVAIPTRTAPLS